MAKSSTPSRNQMSVLDVLAEADHEMTGMEVAGVLADLGRSSTYAALAALQRDNLIAGRWDVTGPRPVRLVQITAAGRDALISARARVRAYKQR